MKKYKSVRDQKDNWIVMEKYKLAGDKTERDSSTTMKRLGIGLRWRSTN